MTTQPKPEQPQCSHERLNEDGICRFCGADMRTGHDLSAPQPSLDAERSLLNELVSALEAIRLCLKADAECDSGEYWSARKWLRDHNRYEGNLQLLAVPLEVAEGCAANCRKEQAMSDAERREFEKWAVKTCADLGLGRRSDEMTRWEDYWDPRTHFAWQAWQARAEQPAVATAKQESRSPEFDIHSKCKCGHERHRHGVFSGSTCIGQPSVLSLTGPCDCKGFEAESRSEAAPPYPPVLPAETEADKVAGLFYVNHPEYWIHPLAGSGICGDKDKATIRVHKAMAAYAEAEYQRGLREGRNEVARMVLSQIASSTGPTGGWLDSPKALAAAIRSAEKGSKL